MTERLPVPSSPAFDAIAAGSQFRDLMARPVRATPDAIFRAFHTVTLSDMPLASALGALRYLPGRLLRRTPPADAAAPFLDQLIRGGTLILDDDAPREILTGSAGQLHRIIDQAPVHFETRAAFDAFVDPDHEKLFMSIRVAPTGRPGEHWLVLEHATVPLSARSARRFRRYWRVIRPTGRFVTQHLLRAIAARARRDDARDVLLDRFMPAWDVVERHQTRVGAPADVTLTAARELDLFGAPLVHAIFKAREWLMRSQPAVPLPRGLMASVLSIGWGVLAEVPGREVVVGAITKPWEPNPTFHALPPDDFAAFAEPGYVKIAWTLRADPLDASTSFYRTETRAMATDAAARRRFRRYWRVVSPGIWLIRRLSLAPLRRDAERRWRGHGGPMPEGHGPATPVRR
jgi:hypothetical protein